MATRVQPTVYLHTTDGTRAFYLVALTSAGVPVTGLVNGDWNKSAHSLNSGAVGIIGTITEVDSVNLPGVYLFECNSGDFNDPQHWIAYFDASGAATVDVIVVPVVVGLDVTSPTVVAHVNTISANAVNASALAADAVVEIQAGLATSAEVAALPTAAEIDAELTGTHGAGSWSGSSAPTAAAVAAAVWAEALENNYTAADLVRLLIAVTVADGEDLNTTNPKWKSLDATKIRVTGVTTPSTRNSTVEDAS